MSQKPLKSESTQTKDILKPIEYLRKKYKMGQAVYAGVCAANGWKSGKMLTEKEFLDGVSQFVKASMDGRKEGKIHA